MNWALVTQLLFIWTMECCGSAISKVCKLPALYIIDVCNKTGINLALILNGIRIQIMRSGFEIATFSCKAEYPDSVPSRTLEHLLVSSNRNVSNWRKSRHSNELMLHFYQRRAQLYVFQVLHNQQLFFNFNFSSQQIKIMKQ